MLKNKFQKFFCLTSNHLLYFNNTFDDMYKQKIQLCQLLNSSVKQL